MSDLVPSPDLPCAPLAGVIVEEFFEALAESTRKEYQKDWRHFSAWMKESEPAKAFLGRGHGQANRLASRWRQEMLDSGLGTSTVARRIAMLRSLCRWARAADIIQWELILPRSSSAKVEPNRDLRAIGEDAWEKMMAACELSDDLVHEERVRRLRERLFVLLLWDTGIRPLFAIRMEWGDLNEADSVVLRYDKGRGNQKIRQGLSRRVMAAMAAVRTQLGNPGPGERMLGIGSPSSARDMLARVAERAGLGRVCPRMFRRAFVTRGLDATNGDLRKVAQATGHKDQRALQVYDDERRGDGGALIRRLAGEGGR